VPSYISELLLDSSDESDDDNEDDAAADVIAADNAADNAADVDENTGDYASNLETEPTVPKTSTTEKVAVPKTSKKRGPRGPYKKKTTIVSLLCCCCLIIYFEYKNSFNININS